MTGLSLVDKVTIGSALLGGAAGVAGSFAVLRRRSLVGDMLAHASLPGVCGAFLLTGSRDLLGLSLGALASGLLAIGLMTVVIRYTRTKEDAAIGIMLSAFFGLGVVLLSRITRGVSGSSSSGLNSYLFGEPGNMVDSDLTLLLIVAGMVLGAVALLFKEFKLVSFDADFARSQGWPTLGLDLAMMGAVAGVTIIGLPIVGVILMAAMIILPAATARLWTKGLHTLLILAGVLGMTTGAVGIRIAKGYPAGPMIVLTGASLFVASLLFAPERGVLAKLVEESRLRMRVARDHLLRSLYELSEPALPRLDAVPRTRLAEHRHVRWWTLQWLLAWAERGGLLEATDDEVRLTPLGLRRAAEATKRHRMWEMYMMEFAGSAADHVDRSADAVEHLLPEGLLVKLEERLASEGRMPAAVAPVPASPHRLREEAP
ncbi:MAG TPA: metal ABC transporter permease [Lacipirellulaceae bacterium]|nr:metal ABC transporter permease [Lacipirellulaceae bacterium]